MSGRQQRTSLILDLDFVEDSEAAVDMNIVMTDAGAFVELQGTGEEATFTREEMNGMVSLAEEGINKLFKLQEAALGETAQLIGAEMGEQS